MGLPVYKGNQKLKSAGVSQRFTKEQVEEATKCYNDPVYFIENYVKIVHVDRGIIPFKLYDYQKEMVKLILGERHVIMKLPRQSGKSETTAACVLWYMLFQEYKTVAVLANKASTARIILGRIQSMYENLPKWMQVGVVEWNKGSFQLGNHNRCFGAATGGSAIRGCISGNSLVEIKENDIVKKVSIQNLFENILDSKGDTAINSGSLLVNSPNGWSNFDSLVRYEYDQFLNIKTDSGNLKVSLNHPIFTENGWENAENLKIGDILIKKNGKAKIVDIEKVNDTCYLYDFLNVNN